MSLDPTSKQGLRMIKEGLASKVHITRYAEVPNFSHNLMITFSIEIGIWVISNNRLKAVIAYLYLSVVH